MNSVAGVKRVTLVTDEINSLKTIVKASLEHGEKLKPNLFSNDSLKAIKDLKLDFEPKKDFLDKAKQVVGKFFSIDENWTWKRNLFGAFLVYLPEIPAYFIPSYTQAKKTGTAKDLKHGEGVRGLITGGLEGLAVGAIVSGKEMSPRKIAPFFLLGAIIQFGSSLVLPRIGEKVGTLVYNKHKYAEKLEEIIDIPFSGDPNQPTQLTSPQKIQAPALTAATPNTQAQAQLNAPQNPQTPTSIQPQFKGSMPYNKFYSGSLKV